MTSSSSTGTTRTPTSSIGRHRAAPVVLDAPDEAELAARAGVGRVLVRVTLGRRRRHPRGDSHRAPRLEVRAAARPGARARRRRARTRARRARRSRPRRLAARGLRRAGGDDRTARGVRRALPRRARLGRARVADLGGRVRDPHTRTTTCAMRRLSRRARRRPPGRRFSRPDCPSPSWLEPGRSLVGRAGVTLYRVGSVKRLPGRTWVAVDGGMSDNPGRSSTTRATPRSRRTGSRSRAARS